jgi:hypothetical protein
MMSRNFKMQTRKENRATDLIMEPDQSLMLMAYGNITKEPQSKNLTQRNIRRKPQSTIVKK